MHVNQTTAGDLRFEKMNISLLTIHRLITMTNAIKEHRISESNIILCQQHVHYTRCQLILRLCYVILTIFHDLWC